MLSVRRNRFLVCSVCDKMVSTYAQHALAIIFENTKKNPKLKCKFRLKKIKILKNRLGTHIIGPQWTFWEKKNFGYLSKKFGSGYAQSTRKYSNFKILAKIEGKEAKKISPIYQGHIRIWFRSKYKSKLFHACEPLTRQTLSFFYYKYLHFSCTSPVVSCSFFS